MRSNCVVDVNADRAVLWHVDTGPNLGISRLGGAWVLERDDPRVADLVSDRWLLATARARRELDVLSSPDAVHMDTARTVGAIREEVHRLQRIYLEHPQAERLVEPEWPNIPNPPQEGPVAGGSPPDLVHDALMLARWLDRIANLWDQIERQRLARPYMSTGTGKRVCPISIEVAAA
ncbi:hypothetical protein [Actinoalloteichus spitiensis]|uniref:hypothetical protein n=1 Tax=Actinoalloteichus spitiensis TaxID=252394 RepID=UPI000302B80E|nr:hypothetical protein [Actinoalloteichus spitiensis]